jgi:hypothetical protein
MTKWYEESPGVVSSLRVILMGVVILGGLTIGAGIVGFFLKIPDSSLIIGAGSGLISLSLAAKAFQANAEKTS